MEYQAQFFISAIGISREVITTDICRYLGNNARISGPKIDTNGEIIGYWYWAYRAFTDEMVRSLREDSAKWKQEKERNFRSGFPDNSYAESQTYHDINPFQAPNPNPVPPGSALENPGQHQFVYDHLGNRVYDLLEKKYLIPQPRQLRMEDPTKGYPSSTQPGGQPVAPDGYWATDPTTGQQYFVVDGRIIQLGDRKEQALQ